jgi:hypothetical protein
VLESTGDKVMKKKYENGIDFREDFSQSDFLDSVSCTELDFDTIPMGLMNAFEDSQISGFSESKLGTLEKKKDDIWDTPEVTKYNK